MKVANTYTIFCLLFLSLFLSFLPNLFRIPLRMSPAIKSLAIELTNTQNELEEKKSVSEMEQLIIESYRTLFLWKLFYILLGIIAGILLLFRKISGRYLAIGISIYGLINWIYGQLSSGNIIERLIAKFTILIRAYPLEVFHRDIVSNIIYLSLILYLLRPSISKEFNSHYKNDLKT